jgi:hypothetical protein
MQRAWSRAQPCAQPLDDKLLARARVRSPQLSALQCNAAVVELKSRSQPRREYGLSRLFGNGLRTRGWFGTFLHSGFIEHRAFSRAGQPSTEESPRRRPRFDKIDGSGSQEQTRNFSAGPLRCAPSSALLDHFLRLERLEACSDSHRPVGTEGSV